MKKKTISTIGFGIASRNIILKNGKKIKLKLIDTAGQENYQALASTYIKNADCVLFVFALDNQESFHNIKKWLDNFKENNKAIDFNKTIPAYIVGTKSNLEHKINKEEIEEVRKENNFYGYFEISDDDDSCIIKLFEEVGEILFKIYGNSHKPKNIRLSPKAKNKKKGCILFKPDF